MLSANRHWEKEAATLCFAGWSQGRRQPALHGIMTLWPSLHTSWSSISIFHHALPAPWQWGGDAGGDPVWLGGRGHLGEAGVKELMLRTPGACWRMGGNSQSAQHRKSSADLQLSCQADEHSQLVGGNAALSLLICMDITPGAPVLPRRPQEMREQRMPRCPRTNRQLSDVQWRSRGHCRGQGKVSMRTLTLE